MGGSHTKRLTQLSLACLLSFSWSGLSVWGMDLTESFDETRLGGEKQGWWLDYDLEGQVLFNHNHRVVNKENGVQLAAGLQARLRATSYRALSEWRNELSIKQQFQREPVLSRWMNMMDELALDSLYFRKWKSRAPWGIFGRANLKTSLFSSFDDHTSAKTFEITERDGSTESVSTDRLRLSRSFQPLQFRENLGLFYRPIETSRSRLEILLGGSLRQNLSKGQRVVSKSNSPPPDFLVNTLGNSYLAGAEAQLNFSGELKELLNYELKAEWMMPFYDSARPDDKSLLQRSSWLLGAEFRLELLTWLRVVSETRLWKEPQLQNRSQFLQALSLRFGFSNETQL
ncbi:MAG: hypothetical protein EA369_08595 [Bradymonadales bacterium]|nr:MAG: hypothetical protein EA369_08595 [Bradymonadales bacterium]